MSVKEIKIPRLGSLKKSDVVAFKKDRDEYGQNNKIAPKKDENHNENNSDQPKYHQPVKNIEAKNAQESEQHTKDKAEEKNAEESKHLKYESV